MEKKSLSQEELKAKIWEQNQAKNFTASSKGRSAAQGIKLLLIRDYLHKYTDKEHPKNAKDIVEYLATQGIKAERKTIYNDILRLQTDLQEPIEYNPKKWGYYITQPEFETKKLRMLIESVQLSPSITKEESDDLVDKILELGTVYAKDNLDKNIRRKITINKPESSVFQNIEIISKAISLNKKIRYRIIYPTLKREQSDSTTNNSEDFIIVSPKEIRCRNREYILIAYADKRFEANYGIFSDYPILISGMADIEILSQNREQTVSHKRTGKEYRNPIVEREHYSFDPYREYAVTILFHKADMKQVKRRFGNDTQFIPYDEHNMMITVRTQVSSMLFDTILSFGAHAKILSPKEAIGEFFEYIKKGMREMDELYGYDTPDFLKDVPTNYDDLRAQQHRFKHTKKIRKPKQ